MSMDIEIESNSFGIGGEVSDEYDGYVIGRFDVPTLDTDIIGRSDPEFESAVRAIADALKNLFDYLN